MMMIMMAVCGLGSRSLGRRERNIVGKKVFLLSNDVVLGGRIITHDGDDDGRWPMMIIGRKWPMAK